MTIPLATKITLYGALNVRYFWEKGVLSSLQGTHLVVTLTIPIPSLKLE